VFGGGCGCLPDTVIRWLVFSVLLLGGVAIVVAGRRRARRDATTSTSGRGATRATVAGAIVAVLGVLVAVGAPEADLSLAFLAAGAVVATAGVAPTRRRGADRTTTEHTA
jgi:hypothetical protein